jgi:hypothetical protein
MEYSYYLLDGQGLNAGVVMGAIDRARRRFFFRPSYIWRHLGDIVRLATTKRAVVWHVLVRTLLGRRRTRASSDPAEGLERRSEPATAVKLRM